MAESSFRTLFKIPHCCLSIGWSFIQYHCGLTKSHRLGTALTDQLPDSIGSLSNSLAQPYYKERFYQYSPFRMFPIFRKTHQHVLGHKYALLLSYDHTHRTLRLLFLTSKTSYADAFNFLNKPANIYLYTT